MSRLLAVAGPDLGTRLNTRLLRELSGAGPGAVHEWSAPGVWMEQAGQGGGVASSPGAGTLILDGRIFNRDELTVPGDDADALLLLAGRDGLGHAMARINADAAAVLWNPRRRTLSLARDRWGTRPLYWAIGTGMVGVASRPRPLLSLPGVRVEADPFHIALVAGSHHRMLDVHPQRTPYLDVQQVPAASMVTITLDAAGGVRHVHTERYWSIGHDDEVYAPEAELAEEYRELLADAVRRRMTVAERAAFMLSGGLDSGSVLATAVRGAGLPQVAYSTIYEDRDFDERAEIASMLPGNVSDWRPVEVGVPDVLDTVARMVAMHDGPVATATWLSHTILAQRAEADGVGSLIGGMGGNELNVGEYEYFPFHFADLLAEGDVGGYSREVRGWVRHHDDPVFRKDAWVADDLVERLAHPGYPGRVSADTTRLRRYVHTVNPAVFDLSGWLPVMEHRFDTCLRNRMWQDLTRESLPARLRAEERNLTPLGIERFHPFLDHRLAEFMFRVPGRMTIRDGVTKHLLREAMRGVLPEATRTRIPKTAWHAPAHIWFSGDNREPLLDLIASRSFRERGVYDLAAVDRIVEEHQRIVLGREPRENHMMFLWQLVNLELWLRDVDGLRDQVNRAATRTALA